MKETVGKVKKVMEKYSQEFPEINVDRDYYPFKLTEEWGECLQAYLMLTKRGREKGLSENELQENFENELADVFGFLLLFAEHEGVDLEKALEKKWFTRLNN